MDKVNSMFNMNTLFAIISTLYAQLFFKIVFSLSNIVDESIEIKQLQHLNAWKSEVHTVLAKHKALSEHL